MEPTNQNLNQNLGGLNGIPDKKSKGPLIAVIVILFLIIIGGLYFLGQRMNKSYTAPTDTSLTTDPVTDSMNTQSDSDDVSSIQADLNATNINSIDQGAAVIEAELQ